jgi:hypothetical protein
LNAPDFAKFNPKLIAFKSGFSHFRFSFYNQLEVMIPFHIDLHVCELEQLSFDHNVVELHACTYISYLCIHPKNGLDNGALLHESKHEWIWLSLQ